MKGFIITVTVIICITFVSCTQNSQQKEILNKVFKSNPLLEECSKSIEPHLEKCDLDRCELFGFDEITEKSSCCTIWGTLNCILSWAKKLCDNLVFDQFEKEIKKLAALIESIMCESYPMSDEQSCYLNSTTISNTEETATTEVVDTTTEVEDTTTEVVDTTTEVVDTTTKGHLPELPKLIKPIGIFNDVPDIKDCVAGCPPKQTKLNNRIIGGSFADVGEIYYQCAIISLALNPTGPVCGCSIHNKTTVITAGHCCEAIPKTGSFIYYNTNRICLVVSSPIIPSIALIKDLHIHPNYNSTTVVNDICVISLLNELELNTSHSTANLIEIADTEPADGTPLLVSGWGIENSSYFFQPTCLKKLDLKVFNRQQCSNMYGNSNDTIYRVDNSTICAITPMVPGANQDTCSGDSGGPVVYKDEKNVTRFVGIVSKGTDPCGQAGYAGVYSSVPHLKNFILYGTA